MKHIIALTLAGLLLMFSCQQKPNTKQNEEDEARTRWVDSTLASLDLKQKVGQLFFAATYSNRNQAHYDSIRALVSEHQIGGLIFFQGGPGRQASLSNAYQDLARVPLMIGIDGEWGMKMRLDSTFRYPYNMTLGAVHDTALLRKVGQRIGLHARAIGVHMNYAPDVDVNTNPSNPVIGVRSFGESPEQVSKRALAFVRGMQSTGVLGCAKHFPGHGDTETDSHHALPMVNKTLEQMDSIDLLPYKTLIREGLGGVMVGHLDVVSLTGEQGRPSSLSKAVITDLLKHKLGFEGVVMTDALNMKGVANFSAPGEVDRLAFEAGNDMLLFSEDIPRGIALILEALESGQISPQRLDQSVRKILAAKYDAGLSQNRHVALEGLIEKLNQKEDSLLYRQIASKAVTLVKADSASAGAHNAKYAYLGIGEATEAHYEILSSYLDLDRVSLSQARAGLQGKTLVVDYARANPRNVRPIDEALAGLIEELAGNNRVILNVYASQYVLRDLDLGQVETLLVAYENSPEFHHTVGAILSGKSEAQGRLPASLNQDFKAGHGL